ncbi:hypothetical protein H4R34_000272 [Dimargaris verticillata]|uniref:Sodium/calcium exchanger protein-domain-containing protein n=1 Tax=Dimargaris verticillata TaxID=2761393 RepID=A0A9W8BAP0_9FUNG|nr:hypothetical protein H4R34_000272 [Dimargaris verticillata]
MPSSRGSRTSGRPSGSGSKAAGTTDHIASPNGQPSCSRQSSTHGPTTRRRGCADSTQRRRQPEDRIEAAGDASDASKSDGNSSHRSKEPEAPRSRSSRVRLDEEDTSEGLDDDDDADSILDDPDATLKARQEAMNIAHPFGLPLWKPALYKKSRSITRFANRALHSMPRSSTELWFEPGNVLWLVLFGWWMALWLSLVALVLRVLPIGTGPYGRAIGGLAWYLLWPFGRSVERERCASNLVPASEPQPEQTAIVVQPTDDDQNTDERQPLLDSNASPSRPTATAARSTLCTGAEWSLAAAVYYTLFYLLVTPVLLVVCGICWFMVVTVPMAKLTYKLWRHLRRTPLLLRFRSRWPTTTATGEPLSDPGAAITSPGLSRQSTAMASHPNATILLCITEATGSQYYKYTIDGVNIMFINLMFVVLFTLFDAHLLGPWTDHATWLSSEGFIFVLCLVSTIPLSYFIGQAVSSISAQSSLGLGAVINATFGSIIEVILYMMAVLQGKAVLVEGSLIGSFLAGLLLMPGLSMIAGGIKRKEQRFYVRSAGVSSTLLIMSIIGAFAPTLFYQTYGSYKLMCEQCPNQTALEANGAWQCTGCRYVQEHPALDPFYASHAKTFMYLCVGLLPTAYLIGLWFTLRTHVKHIYSHTQAQSEGARQSRESRFMNRALNLHILQHLFSGPSGDKDKGPLTSSGHPSPAQLPHSFVPLSIHPTQSSHRDADSPPHAPGDGASEPATSSPGSVDSSSERLPTPPQPLYTEQHLLQAVKAGIHLPRLLTTASDKAPSSQAAKHSPELNTESNHPILAAAASEANQLLPPSDDDDETEDGEGHGHDAPNWSKSKSAMVLLTSTALFAAIAELLVESVDSVVEGGNLDEKFLGMTLFALVPNVPEFTNAILFAYYNNIALALEICSQYTVQVALLQIPALVAFSGWWTSTGSHASQVALSTTVAAGRGTQSMLWRGAAAAMGSLFGGMPAQTRPLLTTLAEAVPSGLSIPAKVDVRSLFIMIFPRWDLIAVLFSIYLLTYTYIEGKSNYFKGAILCMAYSVWLVSFYFEPDVYYRPPSK